VYSASEDAILFSQPEQGVLRKVDLKTGKVSTLLKKNETIPNPGALCVAHEKIYVADWKLGSVYEWIPKKGAAKDDPAPYELRLVYKAKSVVRAMASSEKNLYISQSDPTVPLVRLLPDGNPVPVTFLSVWGELLDKHYWAENFLGLNNGLPLGWVGDPTSDRKFYMANSNGNVVVSFRDLSQEELLNSESYNSSGITEFEYPLSKPPRTFRILLVGDAHTYHMYAADNQKRGMKYYNRMNGLSKRLELTLNTLASWEDAPIHFEVIHQGAVSWNPLNIWPYYEVPPTVKKYDIDLVLYMLIPTTDLGPYYAWPMTSQGIPTAKADPEYLLKPAKDRIPGGLPRKLYDLCKAKNIVTIFNNQVRFDNTQEMVQDPEILD